MSEELRSRRRGHRRGAVNGTGGPGTQARTAIKNHEKEKWGGGGVCFGALTVRMCAYAYFFLRACVIVRKNMQAKACTNEDVKPETYIRFHTSLLAQWRALLGC